MERDWRELLVMPLIVGIMLVPVGIFSGEAPAGHPPAYHYIACIAGRIRFCICRFGLGLLRVM